MAQTSSQTKKALTSSYLPGSIQPKEKHLDQWFSYQQFMGALVVAGPSFLLICLLLDKLAFIDLSDSSFSLRENSPTIFSLILATIGLLGILGPKCRTFFRRWSNNRRPIIGDTIILGAGIGSAFVLIFQMTGQFPSNEMVTLLPICITCFSAVWWLFLLKKKSKFKTNLEIDPSLVDEPISDLTEKNDSFGRLPFVSLLSSAIEKSDPACCHVFGLVGTWGSGKTTITRAIARELRTFHTVTIDSWNFRDTGRLTEAILAELIQELNKHYLFPNLRRSLSRYLSIVSPPENLPFLASITKLLANTEELESLKSHLENVINSTGARFCVFIDDVDRLDNEEFQSLLKTIRLSASLPRVVYILAYDRDSVYQMIADNPNRSHEFMDKVIEDEWILPLIPADKLQAYLLKHLSDVAGPSSERFKKDFEQRFKENFFAIRQILRTPRQIKRAGISLSRRSKLISRLNYFDAFIWEILRQRQPRLFELISRKPWMVCAEFQLETDWMDQMLINEEQRGKNIEEIKKVILETGEENESISKLFWTLFNEEQNTSDSMEASQIRLRRICQSRFFNAYFLLEFSDDVQRIEQIELVLARLNATVSREDQAQLILTSIKSSISAKWLPQWISLMIIFSEELQLDKISTFIDTIRRFGNDLREPKNKEDAQTIRSLAEMNMTLVERLSNSDLQNAIKSLISDTVSLAMASVYIQNLIQGFGKGQLDVQQYLKLFDTRLENEVIHSGVDVFESPNLTLLLHFYSNRSRLFTFIEEAADENPSSWAKLLLRYVLFWADGGQEVNPQTINQIPSKLLKKAEKILSVADISVLSGNEQKAVTAFLKWHSEQSGMDHP